MSDTILSGDFTVYYEADNRQKRLEWTGSATGTRSVNELYSALQDLFDELAQMDDGTPMSAQTPTEYTIGIIDAGDDDPWFIDLTSVEHLTGGAISTASWLRAEGTNTGIIKMDYTAGVALSPPDKGRTIVMTVDGDSGTILDFNVVTLELWIRPDTDAAANSFDDTTPDGAWTVTGSSATGNQDNGAAISGEQTWANIFSIGTIASNTHLYVSQNDLLLTAYKSVTDWWVDGQIDFLVLVQEMGALIDEGFIEVFARRYTATYDHFIVDASSGGRNPIPLATGTDLNNTTGYRQFTGSSGSGTFTVGEVIEDDTDETIQGVLTAVGGTVSDPILSYYLIGDPLNDFTGATGGLTGADSGATCTAAAPADIGPAVLAGTAIVHSSDETLDIDEDTVTEDYSIVIDCSAELLADVYEWSKYITRRGGVSTGDTDGQEGQFYIGSELRFNFDSEVGDVTEGQVVTQVSSGATGVVVAENSTTDQVILRSTRGVFVTNQNVEFDGSNRYVQPLTNLVVITPIKVAPYGTFAGGIWFCAPGVALINVPGADANNYRLTDDTGFPVQAPVKVTAIMANLREFDAVAMFRLTTAGGIIDKAEYTAAASTQFTLTLNVGSTITADTPSSGVVRLVGDGEQEEWRMRFASFATTIFTLDGVLSKTTDGGTTETTITDAAGNFTADLKPGDLIVNQTRSGEAHVLTVDSDTTCTLVKAITGQVSGDTYHINALPITVDTSDNVYVPLIDIEEDTGTDGSPGTEEAILTYLSDIEVRGRVRQAGVILPFEVDGTIGTGGLTITAIRTPDTIFV